MKIRKPDHPMVDGRGFIKRSILNWEEYYGKPWPKDTVPHHIDHDITNDHWSNIESVSIEEHSRKGGWKCSEKSVRNMEEAQVIRWARKTLEGTKKTKKKKERKIVKRGYLLILIPDHLLAQAKGYVAVHRFNWTKYHGPIPKGKKILFKNKRLTKTDEFGRRYRDPRIGNLYLSGEKGGNHGRV